MLYFPFNYEIFNEIFIFVLQKPGTSPGLVDTFLTTRVWEDGNSSHLHNLNLFRSVFCESSLSRRLKVCRIFTGNTRRLRSQSSHLDLPGSRSPGKTYFSRRNDPRKKHGPCALRRSSLSRSRVLRPYGVSFPGLIKPSHLVPVNAL